MVQFLAKDPFKQCLIILVLAVCRIAAESETGNPGRIIGGTDVSIDEVPYMVSVRYRNKHGCGGTIITVRHVLTAAHCVGTSQHYQYLTVMAGSTYHERPGDVIKIKEVTVHPNFDKSKYDLDAAVLTLEREPRKDLPISPLNLRKTALEPDDEIFICGWGITTPGTKTYSPNLKGAMIEVFADNLCVDIFGSGSFTSNMFCAGVPDGSRDACTGDSGGPAVYKKDWLVGIISWGKGCGQPWEPGVYTSVSVIYDWVQNVTTASFESLREEGDA